MDEGILPGVQAHGTLEGQDPAQDQDRHGQTIRIEEGHQLPLPDGHLVLAGLQDRVGRQGRRVRMVLEGRLASEAQEDQQGQEDQQVRPVHTVKEARQVPQAPQAPAKEALSATLTRCHRTRHPSGQA